jgi:hypothetical protein
MFCLIVKTNNAFMPTFLQWIIKVIIQLLKEKFQDNGLQNFISELFFQLEF